MRKILPAAAVSLVLTTSALADGWSLGAGIGPFVFGNFAERTATIVTEDGQLTSTSRLSAATRPGATADLERSFSERVAMRLEASWTRAPLKIKSRGGSGVAFDAGHAGIITVALPLVFTINPHGTFRFHLAAGPAYGLYEMDELFNGTRGRWGGMAGGGVAWWLSDRFAIEGEANDLVTASPLRKSDFASGFGAVKIPKTHNVHTTAGIRYRF